MDRLLVIGGTSFVGRNLIEQLVKEDRFDITICNRGKTNADLFPQLNRITCDRYSQDFAKITEQHWDYIIDISCYYPSSLEMVLGKLNPNLKKYVFISTCSVYNVNSNDTEVHSEDYSTLTCKPEEREDESPQFYGQRKVACEDLVTESGLPYVILRPSLIYGKYDPTDRLYYWLYQAKMRNTILIPDNGSKEISLTYVHDFTKALIDSLQSDKSGIYNMTSSVFISIIDLAATAAKLLNKAPKYVSASSEFLKKNNINQWTDMPLWINGNHFRFDNDKYLKDFRTQMTPFEQSIKEFINYFDSIGWHEPKYGMPESKRLELLDRLK